MVSPFHLVLLNSFTLNVCTFSLNVSEINKIQTRFSYEVLQEPHIKDGSIRTQRGLAGCAL